MALICGQNVWVADVDSYTFSAPRKGVVKRLQCEDASCVVTVVARRLALTNGVWQTEWFEAESTYLTDDVFDFTDDGKDKAVRRWNERYGDALCEGCKWEDMSACNFRCMQCVHCSCVERDNYVCQRNGVRLGGSIICKNFEPRFDGVKKSWHGASEYERFIDECETNPMCAYHKYSVWKAQPVRTFWRSTVQIKLKKPILVNGERCDIIGVMNYKWFYDVWYDDEFVYCDEVHRCDERAIKDKSNLWIKCCPELKIQKSDVFN